MAADLARVTELAPKILTRGQALKLLEEATLTAKDVADRAADLPLIDGGSRTAISEGVTSVLNYGARVREELEPSDPISDRSRQRVALVVAQMESWLAFVDGEVKGAHGFLYDWAMSVPTILSGALDTTLSVIDQIGKQTSKTVSDLLKAVPWYVWTLAAGVLVVLGVVIVKGEKA